MTTSAAEQTLIEALEGIVGARHVLVSLPDKLAYARDCWPRGIILVRGGRLMEHHPLCVAQPADEAEVAAVVRAVRAAGLPIIPYGAGSGVCGGTLPDRGGVVVDVKRLNSIEKIDVDAFLMRVGAGAIGQVVQTELERRGLTLGHFPSSLYCSTVGGYLAGRSAGQYSSRFGKIEDMVQSLRVVTGIGDTIDTAPGLGADRWGGGLDLTQLMVGSEGTLGVITSGVLRLNLAPEVRLYRGFKCSSMESGVKLMRKIMQAGLRPAVMRLYDEFDTLIAGSLKGQRRGAPSEVEPGMPARLMSGLWDSAVKVLPGDVARAASAAPDIADRVRRAGMGLLTRAIGSPLLLNQMTEALPGGCLLVMGFEGHKGAAQAEYDAAMALARASCVDLGSGPGEHWLKNRFNVSYKQSAMFDAGAFTDTMEVSTTWANLMRLYYNVKRAVADDAFIMAHLSHAYAEGCSIYFTFAGFGADTDETLARYTRLWQVAQQAVIDSGASVAHHHGVGVSKAANTGHDHQGGRPLFDALKAAFDPDGIMNPGKVWADDPEVAP